MKNQKRRISKKTALASLVAIVLATPVMAAVLVQNYMEADIAAAAPCFNKTAGGDAGFEYGGTSIADFDATNTTTGPNGVVLTEEKLTLTGMVGDRVVYTDIVRYNNDCDFPITVQLVQATASGWGGAAVDLWISNVPTPGNDLTDNGGTGPDNWNDTQLIVNGAGTVTSAATGTVTIPPNSSVQGGVVIETPAAAAAGTSVGTLNWIAQATA